jgi:hypothetical protein
LRKPVVAVVQGRSPLFVNQSGLPRSLRSLTDVDLSNLEDGSLLIYNESVEKFQASTLLEKQNINGGHF